MASDKVSNGLRSGARFAMKMLRNIAVQGSGANATPAATGGGGGEPDSGSYLFDGDGTRIAYRQGQGLYDAATNELFGYTPYEDGHVADLDGNYLCSIVGPRLWRVYGVAPWVNTGTSPVHGPGIPPPPTTLMLYPMVPPAGFEAFRLHDDGRSPAG